MSCYLFNAVRKKDTGYKSSFLVCVLYLLHLSVCLCYCTEKWVFISFLLLTVIFAFNVFMNV